MGKETSGMLPTWLSPLRDMYIHTRALASPSLPSMFYTTRPWYQARKVQLLCSQEQEKLRGRCSERVTGAQFLWRREVMQTTKPSSAASTLGISDSSQGAPLRLEVGAVVSRHSANCSTPKSGLPSLASPAYLLCCLTPGYR